MGSLPAELFNTLTPLTGESHTSDPSYVSSCSANSPHSFYKALPLYGLKTRPRWTHGTAFGCSQCTVGLASHGYDPSQSHSALNAEKRKTCVDPAQVLSLITHSIFSKCSLSRFWSFAANLINNYI